MPTCCPARSTSKAPKPGDLLVVDILDLGPVPQEVGDVSGQGWGYTGIFAKANGGGFLTDRFPRRLQGGLGLRRSEGHLAAPARRGVHRHHPPRAVRHGAVR